MPLNENLLSQLETALAECSSLREENTRLRELLKASKKDSVHVPINEQEISPTVTNGASTEAKVALFQSLFRGREDVFPVRWQGNKDRAGYSPACAYEWDRTFCNKPRVKCAECENRQFLPVTDVVIRDHLAGKHTIGVYPLLPDETCWFLAADFDKTTWPEDVAAFLETCKEMGVPAALERSRSGNGGHIWIFFDRPIPATQARKLGCAVLTRAMEQRHVVGLDSYDRFFPNQDTLPKGGFGNLIALPLQRKPRDDGNSVFLDQEFHPYPDQWFLLSTLKKMKVEEVDIIVRESARAGKIIGVRRSLTDEEGEEDPWTLPPSKRTAVEPIKGPFPRTVQIVMGNMIYIEKEGLPAAMLNRVMRLAAFQNPEFYKAQAMRLPTFSKPRVIGCAEDFPKHICLPRGCLDDVLELLQVHHIQVNMVDKRFGGIPIEAVFHGRLHPLQQKAAEALLNYDNGVLFATTAFGKTVVASWLIAARKVNTLVVVHRRQLLDQWRERLASFLGLPTKSIGQVGGGRDKRTGFIDIGVIQSLNRKGEVKDMVADYGHVIVDECHHISAFSFEQVLKQVKARYVIGLTATPVRKDGHHPIIMMQCGPIRFRVNVKKEAALRPFKHVVIPRITNFQMPCEERNPGIQDIYGTLVSDNNRNDLIFNDLLGALEEGRSPLFLTERTEHLEAFAQRLQGFARNVIVLRGGMGRNQRKSLFEQMRAIPDGEERVLIATGRYIGEGFDDARLDTLFLAMSISWRGTLQQYAGRLHRHHDNKKVVQIYDYVDVHVPMLMRMYQKRLKGYRAMGYTIQREQIAS